ncbi:MAG: SEC-C domain-containing protein [Rhodoferax sp.]|nr:SEC-C domain-containing protein [Rhodoferax sp.]
MQTPPPGSSEDFEKLLQQAGAQLLVNTQTTAFVDWFVSHAPEITPHFLAGMPPGGEEDAERLLRFMAMNLYGDMPNPANALQAPGHIKQSRNDPCACGSGKKYKQCCGTFSIPAPFGQLNLLRFVLDAYPQKRLAEVAQSKAAIHAVADTAIQWLTEGKAQRTADLLEPYFAGTGPLSVKLSPIFNELMDAWSELGQNDKRQSLVQELQVRGDRPLKSDALQRLTTILADRGDYAAAWHTFKEASAFNPNDPALSFLEVTVLVSEGRLDEARTRARWWASFLARQRDPDLAHPIERLLEMADDPHLGLLHTAAEANPDLQRLHTLFLAAPQPKVRHSFAVHTEKDEQNVLHTLTPEFKPDAPLAKLEKRWRKTFHQVKPMLTAVQNGAEEVWENAADWLDLLQKQPDLWFSFDVLDDLVMALDTVNWGGVTERFVVPMAERAAEQLRLTIESGNAPKLECRWMFRAHRPVLRPIAMLAFVCKENQNWTRFMEVAHWLVLELNPNDNHGLRTDLCDVYARFARWQDILNLQGRYPDDIQPSLLLNAVLAAYKLQDTAKAQALLWEAKKRCPAAVKMLLEADPKPVKPDDQHGGIVVGGKYEAWLYVSEVRPFWLEHKALDWARTAVRPPKRAHGEGSTP